MAVRRIKPNILSERFDESRTFYEDVIGLREQRGLDWALSSGQGGDPTTLCAVVAGLLPDYRGIGLSPLLLRRRARHDPNSSPGGPLQSYGADGGAPFASPTRA